MTRHHIPIPIRYAAAAAAATLILASAAPPAEAVSEVAGATFLEQIVQEVTAVEQDEQAVMQTEQQISMLVNQAVNLSTMPLQLWGQLTAPVMQMQQSVANAEGISAVSGITVIAKPGGERTRTHDLPTVQAPPESPVIQP